MAHHATLSPSGFYQTILCAGSRHAQEGLPDLASEQSILGTAAHLVLQQVLESDDACLRVIEPIVVDSCPEVPGGITLDIDVVEGICLALNYIGSVPGTVSITSEQKVDPADFTLRDDMYGTLDVAIESDFLGENTLEICDFKNGFVVVEVEGCSQLIIYMLGVIAGKLCNDSTFIPDDWIYKTTIIQPRAHHGAGPIRSVVYTYKELLAFADAYRRFADASDDVDAPRTPGVVQCRYCDAKLICVECKDYALLAVRGGGLDVRYLPEETLEEAILRRADALSGPEIQYLLDAEPLVKSFFKAVKEYASQAYDKGVRDFGHKKVKGRARSSWKEKDSAVLQYLAKAKDKDGQPLKASVYLKPAEVIGPSALLAKVKGLVEDDVLDEVKTLVKFGHEKAKLVPTSDAAPAIDIDVSDYFKPE